LWAARGWPLWVYQAWHPGDDEPIPVDVDALVVSPVMAARKGRAPLGTAGLAKCVREVAPLPVYALGGVEAGCVREVLGVGACGVAAIGACYVQPLPLVRELGIIR
jgi:thiamine monophosphate synthase